MDELIKKNILSTGTLMKNSVLKEIHLMNDKGFVKQSRGIPEVSMRCDNKVACTIYFGKKSILMLSTASEAYLEHACKRWCKKKRTTLMSTAPMQ